jgi:PBP1b-binding outer membrane lipoprotein LpoB
MKRIILVLLMTVFVMGCAQMRASEFWDHDTMYKSFDHAKCSIGTFDQKCADVEDN